MNLPLTNIALTEQEAFAKLKVLKQKKLLSHWEQLNSVQKRHLQAQIGALDPVQFFRQKEALELAPPLKHFIPFKDYHSSGCFEDQKLGRQLTSQGAVACLILAGGQGSRLRMEGPKGCVPITSVKHKTLFQYSAEKALAASIQAGRPLEVAVMTSPMNHEETKTFFARHHFFGLDPKQLTFFSQKMWPLFDLDGDLFLESADSIAWGPKGNGEVFRRLVEAGIWQKWKEQKIEWVNVIPIDNPLALPFDHELLGFSARSSLEIGIKASLREGVHENVGVLALSEGRPIVVEYFELPQEEKEARNSLGELKYAVANLGLYCFSMPFILRASDAQMPLHKAKKNVKQMNREGKTIFPDEANAWKFEEFIFDAFPLAERCEAILYPRTLSFAPLKNLKGADSIESVQAALLACDRKVFAQVSGVEPPEEALFELAPQFYYPTQEMLNQWQGKPLPQESYIGK